MFELLKRKMTNYGDRFKTLICIWAARYTTKFRYLYNKSKMKLSKFLRNSEIKFGTHLIINIEVRRSKLTAVIIRLEYYEIGHYQFYASKLSTQFTQMAQNVQYVFL